ncbi:MAG TPA: hypothetical protein VMV86_05055 [Methanosarcinales archaeon]|nr:hypothetical protein [Methanosarcinales archaeon]
MQRKEEETAIIDEDDILTTKQDIGYKHIMMRHLDRISQCSNNISQLGKKYEFCSLVKILHTFMIPYLDDTYKKEKQIIDDKYRKELESIKKLYNFESISAFERIGGKAGIEYKKHKLLLDYDCHNEFFECLVQVMARNGFLIERDGS